MLPLVLLGQIELHEGSSHFGLLSLKPLENYFSYFCFYKTQEDITNIIFIHVLRGVIQGVSDRRELNGMVRSVRTQRFAACVSLRGCSRESVSVYGLVCLAVRLLLLPLCVARVRLFFVEDAPATWARQGVQRLSAGSL